LFIPDPDFYPSRIPDPSSKNSNKGEGWKKLVFITVFEATNFTTLKNYFIFEMLKKKIWANFNEL
jgi:hypothetical protein